MGMLEAIKKKQKRNSFRRLHHRGGGKDTAARRPSAQGPPGLLQDLVVLSSQASTCESASDLSEAEVMSTRAVVTPQAGHDRCRTYFAGSSSSTVGLSDMDDNDNQEETGSSSSTLVVVTTTTTTSPSTLQQSFEIWTQDANSLLQSTELARFVSSSQSVVFSATGAIVHVAFLPVTLPLNLIGNATQLVVGTCAHVLTTLPLRLALEDESSRTTNAKENPTASLSPIEGLVTNVVSTVVPMVLHTAGTITDTLGSTVMGFLGFGDNHHYEEHQQQHQGNSDVKDESFLDRLRIERIESGDDDDVDAIVLSSDSVKAPSADGHSTTRTTTIKGGKFLLKVDDLNMDDADESDDYVAVVHIDLSLETALDGSKTIRVALDAMVNKCVNYVDSHDEARFSSHDDKTASGPTTIDWKAEAHTDKHLRRKVKHNMSSDEWISFLEREVLIWSGKLQTPSPAEDRDTPFFLSRGIVPGRPLDFCKLLWENSRTKEYNRFCLGRSDVLVIDEVNKEHSYGTKIVKSETKVPFTGLSVKLNTLMHVRQLDDGTYIIVSRSVHSSKSTSHHASSNNGKHGHHHHHKHNNNHHTHGSEILVAVNLIRSVEGKPHLTDLTSLSQVKSSLVPPFLASRMGIMGVEQCFNGFRSIQHTDAQ